MKVRLLALFSFSFLCFVPLLMGAPQSYEHPLPDEPAFSSNRLSSWLKKFPSADTNRDGKLSQEEAISARDEASAKQAKAIAAKRKPGSPKPTHADVRYGTWFRNTLDVYIAKSDKPTPVLIHFHGGGWVAGDKSSVNAKMWVNGGITVVSANYRFTQGSPDAAPYPAPMLDAKRAVQYVRSRADEWNIDPNRIALTGGSAGAVISMWIAYQDDMAQPDSDDPVRRESTRVSCLFPVAGPTVLDPKEILKRVGGNPEIHPAMKPFFAIKDLADLETPEKAKLVIESSPVSHVSKDDPPTYLIYQGALGDTPLPATADVNQSIHHAEFGAILKEKLDKVGVICELQTMGDGKTSTDLVKFLKKHLIGN